MYSLLARAPSSDPIEIWLWFAAVTLTPACLVYAGLWLLRTMSRKRELELPGFDPMRRLAPPLCLLTAVSVNRAILPRWRLVSEEDLTLLNVVAIFLGAWAIITVISGIRHWLNGQFDLDRADNLRERRIHTQLGFIEKVVDLGIVVAAVAAALYQVPWGRTLGTSLLASAGVASLIIGFGAQRTLANLIAGFQIAFTQPLRLGDAVVVEEEWGWVEEITLTYVVIRIWDRRRLVLPITYFVEKPFQNWTRTSGQILGSVHLTVSHEARIDAIEKRFYELLDNSERWDRDARILQVVEANERSVVLRALMTAKDSPTCWDLRCEVRRGLLEFISRELPEALPVLRLRTLGDEAFEASSRLLKTVRRA